MNNFQDWTPVSWDKRNSRYANESKKDFITRQQRTNQPITTINKGVSNKSGITSQVLSTKKLESEEETFKHKTLSTSIAKKIAQKRCEMKLTQKDLAFKLSLPESIIRDYEKLDGKTIPNPMILNKIEKILGRVRD